MSNSIPKRWLPYKAIGDPIPGTRFFAFKVPLKEEICKNLPLEDRFSVLTVIEAVKYLGLVIDLTNTNRYYNPENWTNQNIHYRKIYCEGQKVPNSRVVQRFVDIVDEFLKENPDNDKLIGVHCTHGLNRTGYLVCRYMIDKLGFEASAAIELFNTARGHPMEREAYINALHRKSNYDDKKSDETSDEASYSWRNSSSGSSSEGRHRQLNERTQSRWDERSLPPSSHRRAPFYSPPDFYPQSLPRLSNQPLFREQQWRYSNNEPYSRNSQRYRRNVEPPDFTETPDLDEEWYGSDPSYYQSWSKSPNKRFYRH